MKIREIEIKNILSIEELKLSFEDSGLVLVEGWNHDAGRSNGAGKTAIFNALSFALYDKIPRKITASEILKRGAISGCARVILECGTDVWTVERSRPKGVAFYRGKVRVDITQEEWESNLRLTYDQFLMSMYCSQKTEFNSPRFLLTPDTDKKKFLLQLLNLNVFAEVKKNVDIKIKTLEQEVIELTSKSKSSLSKIEAYSDGLQDESDINSSIDLLNKEIEKLKKNILDLDKVVKPDLSKYAKIEEDIRLKQIEFATTRSKRSMLYEKYLSLEREITDYNKDASCSECGSSLDTEEARKAHHNHQISTLESLRTIKSNIDEYDEVSLKEGSVKDLLVKLKDKKSSESLEYEIAKDQINELSHLLKLKQVEVNNLVLKLKSNQELLNKIQALRDIYIDTSNQLSNISIDLELHKTISNVYSPTGAQAYILDSIIDFFNEAVKKHIDLLWPGASYAITSYRETSKGDITAKFSEILTMDGKEVSVGSLSGGELKALSLCVDFAILDVLESQFSIAINPIILDEPFDGLDSVGREIVIELLEKLSVNRQIFVVDHANEVKTMFSKTIRIEKRQDTSSIVIS